MGIISSSRFVNLNVTPCPSAIRTNLPALRSATIPLRHTLKTISCGQIPKNLFEKYLAEPLFGHLRVKIIGFSRHLPQNSFIRRQISTFQTAY